MLVGEGATAGGVGGSDGLASPINELASVENNYSYPGGTHTLSVSNPNYDSSSKSPWKLVVLVALTVVTMVAMVVALLEQVEKESIGNVIS